MERIRLDIIPKGLMPVCHASQYDDGRVIRLDLMDGLQGYSLTDEEIELDVRKPDGHIVTASVDVVAGNTFVDIVTTEQMCAVEGENICELKISKDGAEIYSLNFRMMVEKSVTEGGDPSESFIHNLNQQIYDAVADQYEGNVIFDDVPTANHGTPYTVTSEGIKNAISEATPDNLSDLNDVSISSPTTNQALVWDAVNNVWTNGEVSTVGGLNDLNDVTIDSGELAEGQELVYNGTDAFENKTTRVELTQAEYDQLVADDEVLPDVDYYITDAPSMQGTSADLSYDGTTKSTYTKIEEIDTELSGKADTSGFIDETGVTVTCPRCPIASISRDFARKSGNVLFYGTKISFGNTSESGNIYFFVNKAITNSFIMGTLYDNATDQVYSLGKNYGRDTMWLRQGDQPVSASIFQGKTEISLSLMIIL